MIEVLVSLIASVLALAPPNATAPTTTPTTAPPDFGSELQQLASQFSAGATQLLTTVDGTVIDLARVAYITILLLGTFLYFTHLSRRLGKELITGGVVLGVLSEFVLPAVSRF